MNKHTLMRELPNAFGMAFLTACVTLVLAMGLSWIVGAETRDAREAARCYNAAILDVLLHHVETNELTSEQPSIIVNDERCRRILLGTNE